MKKTSWATKITYIGFYVNVYTYNEKTQNTQLLENRFSTAVDRKNTGTISDISMTNVRSYYFLPKL